MSLAQTALQPRIQADVINWLQTLIQFESVTPEQAGAINWLNSQLSHLGFSCEQFTYCGVTNLIAKIEFGQGPAVAFSGHIDVVPAVTGQWRVAPFSGMIVDDAVYGRGAADMKGGVAAMLSATKQLLVNKSNKVGSFYWLITSDEEGEAEFGSALIADKLAALGIQLDGCIVGEPTSHLYVGDTIKNGRRGALSACINVLGKAGHVAYPDNTINAAHLSANIVMLLTQLDWPHDETSSKTTLQVTGINIPNVVDNMVPDSCEITFNIRYSHGYQSDTIKEAIMAQLAAFTNHCQIQWQRPCEPYYTSQNDDWCLLKLAEQAIFDTTGNYPVLSTSGGTSDGRFFANNHTQVIECGVRNHSIHQVNEHVPIDELLKIEHIYTQLLHKLFISSASDGCLAYD